MPLIRLLSRYKSEFLSVLIIIGICSSISLKKSIYIPTNHIDGAFQTASGLFRIRQGEIPGLDFFPYLGVGPLLLITPFFLILGGNLAASVFAANFVTLITLILSMATSLYLLIKKKPGRTQVVLLSALPLLLILEKYSTTLLNWGFAGFIGFDSFVEFSNPGNSLRPLRAFSAWYLPVVTYIVYKKYGKDIWGHRFLGCILSLNLLFWSNDYALASTLISIILYVCLIAKSKDVNIKPIINLTASFVLVFTITILFLIRNGWNNSLPKYNYFDVRGDQFWYFAPWGRSTRILEFSDFLSQLVAEEVVFSLLLFIGLTIFTFKKYNDKTLVLLAIGAILFIGGSISTIGGHTYIYFSGFKVWGFLISLSIVLLKSFELVRKIGPASKTTRYKLEGLFSISLCLAMLVSQTSSLYKERSAARGNKSIVWNREFGGYIDPSFINKKSNVKTTFLEEYAAFKSIEYGYSREVRVDSVIHALGEERNVFQKALLKKPAEVITSSPNIGEWFNWNLSANWWFYRTLFKEYIPEYNSPTTLIWRKNSIQEWPNKSCEVTNGGQEVLIGSTKVGLYDVNISYRGLRNSSRSFSMIQNNINFASDGHGFMALDPSGRNQSFVIAGFKGGTYLRLKNVAQDTEPITKIYGCEAQLIAFAPNAKTGKYFSYLYGYSNTPFDLADVNWDRGISRISTGFFVSDTPFNRRFFKVNKKCKFANDETRTILQVDIVDGWINVYLSGTKLDPAQVGFPKKFKLLD